MKLLVAASSAPDGGAGISSYSKDLTEVLVRNGHEAIYVSPKPADDTWLRALGLRHFAFGQADDPIDSAKALVALVKRESIDAIINNDHPYVQSIAPAVGCVFVSVGHLQNTNVAALACHNAEWVDYVVTISNDMRDRFISKFNIPTWKAPLIYNGVPDRGHGLPQDPSGRPLRAVFAGGSNLRKGADRVLGLADLLQAQGKAVEIEWFGQLKDDFSRKLQGRSGVTLRGRTSRDAFLETLRQADVLLHPSRVEGCPMTILEAFGFGVASIVCDGLGAMEEIVINGYNGYVCPKNDWPRQALECLDFLASRHDVLVDMKRNSRQRFEAGFTVDVTAANVEYLLRNPTVDRTSPCADFPVLHWHRPRRPNSTKAPLVDRFRIRFGILRKAGMVHTA
jgi:glycosyltransferase involved in cell wall biosynthesis